MTGHAIRTTQAPAGSTKKRGRLADGREILYFDECDHAVHADDKRSLDSASTSSVMRRDNVLGEWVTIASHRQDRTHLPIEAECPLCPSTPDHQTEIPSADYDVVVFENRFPALNQIRPETPELRRAALSSLLRLSLTRMLRNRLQSARMFTSGRQLP